MLLSDPKTNEAHAQSKKVVNYKAELAYGSSRYSGYVGNLSESSIYMVTFPNSDPAKLVPGITLQVKIDPPSKEPVCLHCRVKWSYNTPPHGLTQSIGMEIIDSFPNYDTLLNDIY